jgi:hypothetical protein
MLSEMTIIVGVLLAVLIGYYMTSRSLMFLEGMTDPEKKGGDSGSGGGGGTVVDIVTIAKQQSELTKTAISGLNIKEHRSHYSTINDQLEQWVSAKMIDQAKLISHKLGSNADMTEITKMMSDMNTMKSFKVALDDCAKFVDSH